MTDIIEQDCVFTHEGKTFEASGMVQSADILIAYVGKHIIGRTYTLTDWHGNDVGNIVLTSTWRTPRSFVSSTMHQGYATLRDGTRWTGRTAGAGMSFRGKPTKS